MATESGDKKLLGNFRKLIDEVSADPNYNPANTKLKKTALGVCMCICTILLYHRSLPILATPGTVMLI
jgi:hypothetical protein